MKTSLRQGDQAKRCGQRLAGSCRTFTVGYIAFLLIAMLYATANAAELQDVQYASLPGNQVRVELVLSEPTAAPTSFATDSPARIAMDFVGVTNGLGKRQVPIGVGPVVSLDAVEASNRTRVVINLSNSVPYSIDSSGNRVTIALNRPSDAPSAPTANSPSRASRASRVSSNPTAVRDIDFRRGANREGRVVISLPSSDTRVSVVQRGRRVVAEIMDSTLPPRLFRRLDVTDFGTPVVAVESRPDGGNVAVSVETTDQYDYLAYQTDNVFTLEFRPLTAQERQQLEDQKVVYSGDRLSLNFQDIEVRAVLQLLADFTGFNLVASDTVSGSITLRLKNVPWDQALDIILRTKGLSKRQMGNVIMVAPTNEIVAQETQELEADQQIEALAPLRSEYIQVNYAKADSLATLLKSADNNILTRDRGNVTVDSRTNTLIVQDTGAKLEEIRRLINRLDIPVRQVMIESRIVIANNDFARDLGVRFGLTTSFGNYGGNEVGIAGGVEGHLAGTVDISKGPFLGGFAEVTDDNGNTFLQEVPFANFGIENPAGSEQEALIVNLPVTDPSGAVNFLIGKVGSYLLQLELSAMQREGRGEIVSSPRVITSDQEEAIIKVGQEIPYQEASASGATTVSFKEAVLLLQVTPHITPDDRIIMDLVVNKDNPDFSRSVLGVPPIDTRSVETNVLVDDGETVVLGGVFEREKTFNREQVPWIGDLPIVGNLFKTTSRQDLNEELLIFVTPKILKESLATR